MHLGIVLGVVAMVGGFAAQRGFVWKRQRDATERRLQQKDLDSRRHHFRGSLDVELMPHPGADDSMVPGPDDPDLPPQAARS